MALGTRRPPGFGKRLSHEAEHFIPALYSFRHHKNKISYVYDVCCTLFVIKNTFKMHTTSPDPDQTNRKGTSIPYIFGPRRENPVFGGLRTTQAQTSLRIRAV